jgi:hypothetical protein
MDIPHNLAHVFWGSVLAGGIALASIGLGLTFLLGRLPLRRIGLRLVWISAAMLVAALITMVMILSTK